MLHNDLALVRTIVGLLAADWRGSTCVDSEFKIQDGILDAGRVEAIPMGFDDAGDSSASGRVDVGADDKILGELSEITITVPEMNVVANVDKRRSRMADSFTVLLELENGIIDVVAVVQWNVTVNRLGTPNLGRNFNDESGCGRAEGRERIGRR